MTSDAARTKQTQLAVFSNIEREDCKFAGWVLRERVEKMLVLALALDFSLTRII
jgi:hypothetical protein